MTKISLKKVKGLYLSSRKFPYYGYLITVFPIFCILISNGFINSLNSLLMLFPFVTAMTAGFMYNTFCDADQDPEDKNSITRGDVSKKLVLSSIIILSIGSLIFTALLYSSITSMIIFLIYLFFWLAYSGLKIRFKETIFGPGIASIVLYVGAPIVLVGQFNYFNNVTSSLLLGLFFIYFGHEIKHTILDYKEDFLSNCKTYAVIIGKKNAIISEYITLIIGYIFLITSLYFYSGIFNIFFIGFVILLTVSIISTISFGSRLKLDINNDAFLYKFPYVSTRIFIIMFGCLVLNIPLLLAFFILWILFMDLYIE